MVTYHEEILGILNIIGRSERDGAVRDTHLSKILNYLFQQKTELLKKTVSKLTLVCGMSKRVIRENYIDGLIAFGIIKIVVENNAEIWNWVGLKVFEDKKT